MTVKEAVIATLQVTVPDGSIDLAMINADLDGAATYSKSLQEGVEKCCIPLLYGLYTQQDVGEGGYSLSHPDFYRKVKERLLYLAKKYNLTEILNGLTPTVNGSNPW